MKNPLFFLVDLKEPASDNDMDLKFYLEEILDHPVDLVIHGAIKPHLKPIFKQEVVYA